MIFRIEPKQHQLTESSEVCAGLMVGPGINGKFYPAMYGWGKTWGDAVKDLLNRHRRVRYSSRKAKMRELEETTKIPTFELNVKRNATPTMDASQKAQIMQEIEKVREMIHSTDRVLIAARALDLDNKSISSLLKSRSVATQAIIELSPEE